MGNCINTCLPKPLAHEENRDEEMDTTTAAYPLNKQQRRQVAEEEQEEVGNNGGVSTQKNAALDGIGNHNKEEVGEIGKVGDGGTVRVKIVLTKEELQWLMMQLKSNGDKRLENMLEEIERGRKRAVCDGRNGSGWKPSLESIMEAPKCFEMDRSIIRLP